MNVFPIKEQTFNLSELVSAVELIHTQNVTYNIDPEELLTGRCPACELRAHQHTCYLCGADIARHNDPPPDNSVDVTLSDDKSSVSNTENKMTPPAITTTTSIPAPTVPAPPAITTTTSILAPTVPVLGPATPVVASQSSCASTCWYTITVGCETGVFKGWYNVHLHVIGVPGACFACHSSHAAAEAVYLEAIPDGAVMQVLP
ncbi:hypothetical protein BDR05DRAFT_1003488 [Suillus weaverae]|nr:hypothetical protein BDR05DRAFT_1003488 [Suillus weaverae]